MKVGSIEGYDAIYNRVSDTVFCKNVEVPAVKLIEGYESGLDRYSISKGIVLRKHDYEFTLGCFSFTHNEGQQLIKSIKHARCS